METKQLTAEQFRKLVIKETHAAIAEVRAERAQAGLNESKQRNRKPAAQLIKEGAMKMTRLGDSEFNTFGDVIAGCVYLANRDSYKNSNSDMLVSKMQEGVWTETSKRVDEGVQIIESMGLDENICKTAVRYLRSLALALSSPSLCPLAALIAACVV